MNLSVKNLSKSYGSKTVLNSISLEIENFKSLAIIGPSGGGKSTLLRILAGLEKIDSGDISINGKHVDLGNDDALINYRKKIAVVFQSDNLFPHLTALENVILPLVHVQGIKEKDAKMKAFELLSRFRLEDSMKKIPAQLSGGQQQRVAIVRALACEPEFFLFDEPTSSLDPELTAETLDVIHELQLDNKEMIVVTHQMGFAQSACDHVCFIGESQVLEHGSNKQVFENPQNEKVKQFLDKILEWN